MKHGQYTSQEGFYLEVAQRIGKKELEEWQTDIVFEVKFAAILNFEIDGEKKPSPSDEPLRKAAWELAQELMEDTFNKLGSPI